MARVRFNFYLSKEEREMLEEIAGRLERSPSDTLRVLIRREHQGVTASYSMTHATGTNMIPKPDCP